MHVVDYPDRTNLVLRWREPGAKQLSTRSARTSNRREAERLAIELERELAARWQAEQAAAWSVTRARYAAEVLPGLKRDTRRTRAAALNHVETILAPRTVAQITASDLSRLVAEWRKGELSEATIGGYLGHLKSMLKWCEGLELIESVPRFPKISHAKGKLMKGRPITYAEFKRMLAAVPRVLSREIDRIQFNHLLWGLWLGGLRLGEAMRLTWVKSPFSIDLAGRWPRIRMEAAAHKGKRDLQLPLPDDFCELLLAVPKDQRFGAVFEVSVPDRRVGELISAIGREAAILVRDHADAGGAKYASAHDLRRSFGSRHAPHCRPAILQLLMRHASIETTMKYYVDLDADEVGDELRRSKPVGPKPLDERRGPVTREQLNREEIAEAQGVLGQLEDSDELEAL